MAATDRGIKRKAASLPMDIVPARKVRKRLRAFDIWALSVTRAVSSDAYTSPHTTLHSRRSDLFAVFRARAFNALTDIRQWHGHTVSWSDLADELDSFEALRDGVAGQALALSSGAYNVADHVFLVTRQRIECVKRERHM